MLKTPHKWQTDFHGAPPANRNKALLAIQISQRPKQTVWRAPSSAVRSTCHASLHPNSMPQIHTGGRKPTSRVALWPPQTRHTMGMSPYTITISKISLNTKMDTVSGYCRHFQKCPPGGPIPRPVQAPPSVCGTHWLPSSKWDKLDAMVCNQAIQNCVSPSHSLVTLSRRTQLPYCSFVCPHPAPMTAAISEVPQWTTVVSMSL